MQNSGAVLSANQLRGVTMSPSTRHLLFAAAVLFFAISSSPTLPAPYASSLSVSASFPKDRSAESLDGRLLLLLSTDPAAEPRKQIVLSEKTQIAFGMDVEGMRPGQSITIDDSAFGYPIRHLHDLKPGEYFVQVLLHRYETFR